MEAALKKMATLEQELLQAKNTINGLSNNTTSTREIDNLKLTIQQLHEQLAKMDRERRNDIEAFQAKQK
jgi:uncharacterized protein YicC (UPF0701 family)